MASQDSFGGITMYLHGLGKRIADGRANLGMTQRQLSEELSVSSQTVSKWENGRNLPELEHILRLAEILKIHPVLLLEGSEQPEGIPFTFRGRLFHEENMYTRVRTFAAVEHLTETYQALSFMRDQHRGQFRKKTRYSSERIAYIIHPLMMACHAHALQIRDDAILAGILLHDVVEDTGVTVQELPFSDEVKEIVACVTFVHPDGLPKHEAKQNYYARIARNKKACVVKVLDRCNNVSTMAGSFTRDRLVEYIQETEEFVLPILKIMKNNYPEYSDLAFIVKYHLISLLETMKYLL